MTLLLVNMIPGSLSGESNQDSEPTVAVNPMDPQQIVGTAFTPDPFRGPLAPIYLSVDGGSTWVLNSIVPSQGSLGTGDITVSFATNGQFLYAGILRQPSQDTRLNILRTKAFRSATPMQVMLDRTGVDQPYVQALTVAGGANAGRDRVYVGNNDFGATQGQTTTVDYFLNAGSSRASAKQARLETRPTAGQDGPQARPACHPDGTIYTAFYGWRAQSGDWQANTLKVTADVVVVRDDNWGGGSKPFTALIDPADGLAGVRVALGAQFPFHSTGQGVPGQQRLGGDIAIAVDPRDSRTVYLAWADQPPGADYTLHVRRSTDKGLTWSPTDLRTIAFGINPGLAINADGRVGLLFQQLVGAGTAQRWVTHFQQTADGINWDDLVLATVPSTTPPLQFSPYLGDYDHVLSVGKDFYGVFSANNTPDRANFPNGVQYQRNADFAAHTLLAVDGVTPVRASIDPFFFKITG